MEKSLLTDQEFNGVDFNEKTPKGTDFDNCQFFNCSFASVDLTDATFSECEFNSCDFSSVKIVNTGFKDVVFNECKLLGVKFENCNTFLLEFRFAGCQIDYSTFYKLKLPKTSFLNCSLKEADFTETELTESQFANCDLSGTVFENSLLKKVDFTTALNYDIDLETNRTAKARFSKDGLTGLLSKYDLIIE